MSRLNVAVSVTSRIVDAVVFPVYAMYAALLFRLLGAEDAAEEHQTRHFNEGHTAALAQSRTG